MTDVLGYFGDQYNNPIAYMRQNGLIVFSTKKSLKKYPLVGGSKEMTKIFSNLNYYNAFSKKNILNQTGSGGLFGESNGPCGWNAPSCCFYECEPLWKTQLWPTDARM
jgi:hypothetical protein